MATKRTGFHAIQTVAFPITAPPRRIGEAELALVQGAMAEMASEWSAELENSSNEDAILVLLPDGGDDATGPSFVISRDSYGLRLDQVHWDRLTEIGIFDSFADVIATLRPRLAFCSSHSVPVSATRH